MTQAPNDRVLYPDIEMKHSTGVQIRFSDYDTFGHINNNSYMAFLDLGKSEFLRHVMGRHCSPSELSAAIVNINVDFLAPTVMGEDLDVQTAVVRLGEHSFTLYQRIVNPLTGIIKVQATSTLAGFDIPTQSSAPLRSDLRAALTKLISNP